MITDIIIFSVAIIILIASGALIVKSLSKIAAFLHISEYVVGFILLAFATSLPELFVGISSAINKNPSLILGTVIGSNIANLTLIIGIPVLLARGIKIQSKKVKKDSLWMTALLLMPLILMTIGSKLSRIDGIILLLAFGIYNYKLLKESRQFKKELENRIKHSEVIFHAILFVISIYVLYISSDYVVKYASIMALGLQIPVLFIGLFIIAIGTSLPELVSGISAVIHGHSEMSVGNIIGSVIANSTLVLGVSAIIYPLSGNILIFLVSISFLVFVAIMFTAFVEEKNKISWMEGLVLVLAYVVFLIMEFYLKSFV